MGNFYFASDCFPDTIFMKDRYLLKDQDQESKYKYIKVDGLDTRVVAIIQIETKLFLFSNPGNPITVRKMSKIEQAFKPNKNC